MWVKNTWNPGKLTTICWFGLSKSNLIVETCMKQCLPHGSKNVYYATVPHKHSMRCLPTEVLAVLANPAGYKSMPETQRPKTWFRTSPGNPGLGQVLEFQDLVWHAWLQRHAAYFENYPWGPRTRPLVCWIRRNTCTGLAWKGGGLDLACHWVLWFTVRHRSFWLLVLALSRN